VLDQFENFVAEHREIEARMSDPTIVADNKKFVELTKRYSDLSEIIETGTKLKTRQEDVQAISEMVSEASAEEQAELKTEETQAKKEIAKLEEKMRLLLLPKDPNAGRNVIIEIRGAEGGEEANLFAKVLFEMYQAYTQAQGWTFEPMSVNESDMGGYTEVSFMIKGKGAWTRMKFEAGPHRVQRVPVTESQGRVHTSSATVTVIPEAEDVELVINPKDLNYATFRASGAGGQHVNKTDSAVRLTHLPSGLVVSMQDEKSQLQNKERALKVLRSRLLQHQEEEARKLASTARKSQTGGGGRSEKIRTYNFKENRVTDHRLGLTLHKLERVLAGELDDVSDALVQDERARQLKESEG